MRETGATFDAMRLQAMALDVNLACRRLRASEALHEHDRAALAAAVRFSERAIRGEHIRSSRRLTSSPASDLLALRYAQEAWRPRERRVEVGAGATEQSLRDLAQALTSLIEQGKVPAGSPWTLAEIDAFFQRIFWLATALAATPTDRSPSRVVRSRGMEAVLG